MKSFLKKLRESWDFEDDFKIKAGTEIESGGRTCVGGGVSEEIENFLGNGNCFYTGEELRS